MTARARFEMPPPAIVCSGPQLLSVIAELEAGTYPQPDDAIWRGDLPRDLAVRLAKATGATDEQIAEIEAEDQPAASEPEPERKPAKWQRVDAGPTQVKNLKRAIIALLTEGKTRDELTGVIGGQEDRRTTQDATRPVRDDVAALNEAIKEKYGYEVTRENVRAITADYHAALDEAQRSRPVDDSRRTPEQEAERLAAVAEAEAARQAAGPAPGCKRLTITHSHAEGTFIHGSEKGDGVYELIGPRTLARFKFMPSIRMIGIPQSRDHLAKRGQIDAAKRVLEAAGHVVTVEIDDTPRDIADVKALRAERLEDRAERLTSAAERAKAEGDSRHAAADYYAQRFEGGQPILVGHHSERSARVAQKRMDGHERAAHEAWSKAERVSAAAAVVGREEARRERPAAIRRRIDKLEAELRQTMHHIQGTRPANDWRGAYGDRKPASGEWLEQLTAREAFLEQRIADDRAALEEHKANGYVCLTRDDIHKGDLVTWASRFPQPTLVTRVNPKTVTLDRRSYPRTLPYEQIRSVECPHEGKTTEVRAPRRPDAEATPRPEPVKVERPEPRPEPVEVGAGTEFFPTPAGIVAQMIEAAELEPGLTVLEPSAGLGAIASAVAPLVKSVDCIERDHELAKRLRATWDQPGRGAIMTADFLEVTPTPVYDRVLMNPPFRNQADIRHVTHALKFLKPGGLLVAIMSAGVMFREDKTATAFRALIHERHGWTEELPAGAFKLSGTEVRTVLVYIPAPVAELNRGVPGMVYVSLVNDNMRRVGRIKVTSAKTADGERPAYWAITPEGAMTLHGDEGAAVAHLVYAPAPCV